MPVLVGPGQSAHLAAEDDPDVVEADLGQQALEAGPALDGLAATALVVVDDEDAGWGPAQLDRTLPELVLKGGRLAVLDDLPRGGLADVDDREPVPVSVLDLVRVQRQGR